MKVIENNYGDKQQEYEITCPHCRSKIAYTFGDVVSGGGNEWLYCGACNKEISLSEDELHATSRAREIIREVRQIPCTKCNYCGEVCPSAIPISEIFSIYNKVLSAKISRGEAKDLLSEGSVQAGDCIKCGKCEEICPQNINIKENLEKIKGCDYKTASFFCLL